ncbi:hypothetical protein GOP47_0017405 [Adiantum capillus-veneris]|uniref:Uncharacterized protein n=1 Tax=Adiantum capillus-veneris TaxID=13818 RepID=A0A9D4ZAJ6_ADICA|nr:hypothetical protein GOP47_0017405 [Adiantum capillus-veneris]
MRKGAIYIFLVLLSITTVAVNVYNMVICRMALKEYNSTACGGKKEKGHGPVGLTLFQAPAAGLRRRNLLLAGPSHPSLAHRHVVHYRRRRGPHLHLRLFWPPDSPGR